MLLLPAIIETKQPNSLTSIKRNCMSAHIALPTNSKPCIPTHLSANASRPQDAVQCDIHSGRQAEQLPTTQAPGAATGAPSSTTTAHDLPLGGAVAAAERTDAGAEGMVGSWTADSGTDGVGARQTTADGPGEELQASTEAPAGPAAVRGGSQAVTLPSVLRLPLAAAHVISSPLVWWLTLQVSVVMSGVRTVGWLVSALVWWLLLPVRLVGWVAMAPAWLAWLTWRVADGFMGLLPRWPVLGGGRRQGAARGRAGGGPVVVAV